MKKIIRLTESDLTKIVKKVILETSLSRVHRHIMQHDCAVITGFRNKMENCAFDVKKKDELLKRFEKKDRNFVLKKALLNNGYGVTDVMGSYVENYTTDEVAATFTFTKNLPYSSGSLFVELTPTDTLQLTQRNYVYDVYITSGSVVPITRRILEGSIVVRPAVTR